MRNDIKQASYMAMPGLRSDIKLFWRPHDAANIIYTVSEILGIPSNKMSAKTRVREVVEARQISMYFIKKYTKMSLKAIGELFGGRDHTTTIHSLNTVKDLIDSDEDYKARILRIENILSEYNQ